MDEKSIFPTLCERDMVDKAYYEIQSVSEEVLEVLLYHVVVLVCKISCLDNV